MDIHQKIEIIYGDKTLVYCLWIVNLMILRSNITFRFTNIYSIESVQIESKLFFI